MPVPNTSDIHNPDGPNFDPAATSFTWQNPDPNDPADTVTAEAYLLESATPLVEDPNLGPDIFEPGVQTLAVDAGQESAAVSLSTGNYYYWAVHVTDSGTGITTPGFVWRFQTNDIPPSVNAGDDQYLVTTGSPMALNIDATVTDPDSSPTITWTDLTNDADKNPNTTVTINSPGTEDTSVTLENLVDGEVTGYYIFEITADDGVNPAVTDTIDIVVYGTCGEAADADPTDDYDITGDLNLDCKKDILDFAIFAAGWLDQGVKYQP